MHLWKLNSNRQYLNTDGLYTEQVQWFKNYKDAYSIKRLKESQVGQDNVRLKKVEIKSETDEMIWLLNCYACDKVDHER